MNRIIQIDGGIGRCIAFTGALRHLKEKYPKDKITILTSVPEIFYNNNDIDKVYPLNTPYLFENVIQKGHYFKPEPYNMYEYYVEDKHISTCFNKEMTDDDLFVKPIINLTEKEKKEAQLWVSKQPRPIILFQPHGMHGGKGLPDMTYRSLTDEFAEKLGKEMQKKYDIYIVKSQDQKGIKDLKTFNGLSIRQIIALVPYVHGIVCCDSFMQHACGAFGKKAIVFWGATIPENLGYETNVNILPKKKRIRIPNRLPHNYLDVENINKGVNEFGDEEIKRVMEELDKPNSKKSR